MLRSLTFALLLLLLGGMGRIFAEDVEELSSAEQNMLQALPKVPTLATINGDGKTKNAAGKWVQDLIRKKETRARVEVVLLKQKILAEQEVASSEEKERQRRLDKYNASFRNPGESAFPASSRESRKKTMRLKLEFQVPEIETYRRLLDTLKIREALAADIVETLTRLDRDADGKLSGDEYRDAGFIFLATQRLFHTIDNDEDGYFSVTEIENARALPATGTAAIAAGSATKEAVSGAGYKIKDFDANGDGILSVAERKALSSAYLELALKAGQDADAYRKVMDSLSTARLAAAAKFENLTIESEAK